MEVEIPDSILQNKDSSDEEDFPDSQIVMYNNRKEEEERQKIIEKIRANPSDDFLRTDTNPLQDQIHRFAEIAKKDARSTKKTKSAQKKKKETTPKKTQTPKKRSPILQKHLQQRRMTILKKGSKPKNTTYSSLATKKIWRTKNPLKILVVCILINLNNPQLISL